MIRKCFYKYEFTRKQKWYVDSEANLWVTFLEEKQNEVRNIQNPEPTVKHGGSGLISTLKCLASMGK